MQRMQWWSGAVLTLTVAGCAGNTDMPDPSLFPPLEAMSQRDEAVVRLYAAPIPVIETIAVHLSFAVKRAGSPEFHRWEVWVAPGRPYGYVRRDLFPPDVGIGAGDAYVLAELAGDEAERVGRFIEEESPRYPCRNHYRFFPGPNSNSYVAWGLSNTGWAVDLPPTAIGQNVPALCPD